MTRISSFTAYQNSLSGILNGQLQVNEANAQASSETKASDLKGYGTDAKKLINAKSMVTRAEARTDDLLSLQARATVEATAYSSFTESIESVRDSLNNALAQSNGMGFDAALEAALATAISAANTQFAGQSIFGGVRAYDEPIVSADLDTLAAQANTDANFIDTGANRQVELLDGRTIELSKSAKEIFQPFIDFIRDIRVYENANGKFTGKLSDTQTAYLKTKVQGLSDIQNNALSAEAAAGITAKEIDNAIETNEAKITKLNGIVGDIQNVDLAEVAARLSAAQTQYQASASIFAQLKDLNLLQYLR